jgi:oligosaccharyltransferase complex subunit alpha (ribophorin I)
MKSVVAFATAFLSLLSPIAAGPSVSKDTLSSTFKPPQVFKNANLVHVISVEKNFAKESINVLIENVSKEPQDEYFLPFTTAQMETIGGFEVKDRKNADAGKFSVLAVEIDPSRYYNPDLHATPSWLTECC